MAFGKIPVEISVGGIYFPPVLLVIVIACIMTLITIAFFNRYQLLNYVWYPQLFFVALTVIYIWGINLLWIPF